MYKGARRLFFILLAPITGLMFISTASASCVTPEERAANQLRSLQTQMMVGALQCRGRRDLGQRTYYNQFVKMYKSELGASGKTLIAYFQRAYGDKSKIMLDKHVTSLANTISSGSRDVPEFCSGIASLGAQLAGGNDLLEATYKTPIAFEPNFPICQVDRKTALLE